MLDIIKIVGGVILIIVMLGVTFLAGRAFVGFLSDMEDATYQDSTGTTWHQPNFLKAQGQKMCIGGYVRIRAGNGYVNDYATDGKLIKCWTTSKKGFQLQ
jgi:hypothetical protein